MYENFSCYELILKFLRVTAVPFSYTWRIIGLFVQLTVSPREYEGDREVEE